MRFGTLQLCDEHARQSAVQTSTKVDPFYAAIWSLFTLRLTLDCYDVDLLMHSPDPSDPTVTTRVLTVMLADEY